MPLKPEAKRAYMRERYWKNPERFRAATREWIEQNHDAALERARKWREANPERFAELNKQWRDENKEYLAEKNRAWYEANREKAIAYEKQRRAQLDRKIENKRIAAYQRRKRQTNVHFAIMGRLRARLQMALKGTIKADSTFRLVGCSIGELCAHLESQFVAGMTWENRSLWHIDHIRPCKSFDLSNPDQQRACFHYTNLQPLWESDNRSKGAKLLHDRIAAAKVQMNGTGAPNGIGNQT